MKNTRLFVKCCLLFASITLIGCGGDQNNKPTTAIDITKENKEKLTKGVKSSSGRDYTNKRQEALTILEYRKQNETEHEVKIIEGIYEYEFIHDGKKMSERGAHDGEWIDFNEDYTYSYGKNKKTVGTGKFHFSKSKKLLLMVDNNKEVNPQEWQIKGSGSVMVMIGNTVYGNNNFQMKLINHESVEDMMAINNK